ncbi:class_1 internalin InlA [Hexamita inflata]|uniref:Class 1 internalin InlA n=1 Tax=Hexamita inflata TaxID=28002 RepID=A0AA86TWD3_9EUKA|nr:class 1 internalin InlA [Hexamita inflata]
MCQDGNLEIGDQFNWGDPEVKNLWFLEKFDIQTLKLYIRNDMYVKLRNNTLKELKVHNCLDQDYIDRQQRLNVDDLELENLEVLDLLNINLDNDQLFNLAKFKKLHSLNISYNNVDLTHVHMVSSLTKLYMRHCGLKNIDQISSLVNLEELDVSRNTDLDLGSLCKLQSLTKLSMNNCGLKNIDQIVPLITLQALDISENQLQIIDSIGQLINLKELDIRSNKQIDIAPLKDLVSLIKLNLQYCKISQISILYIEQCKLRDNVTLSLMQEIFNNLRNQPDLQYVHAVDQTCHNYIIQHYITLQYLKKLTNLNLESCNLVSVYVLRPLINLEYLNISNNKIVYLDANIKEMKKLENFSVNNNLISDFSSLEQHPNYNNLDEDDYRCFNISEQKEPSKEELCKAIKINNIECPNIQLKQIQNQHQSLKTAFNSFKKEINTTMSNARQSKIQFTAKIIHIFQYLNKSEFVDQ